MYFRIPLLIIFLFGFAFTPLMIFGVSESSQILKYGNRLADIGKIDSAFVYFRKAIDLSQHENDSATYIETLNSYAVQKLETGNRDKAIELFDEALILSALYKDTSLWARVLVQKSWAYGTYWKTDFRKSLEILQKAAFLQESIDEWNKLPATYKSISNIFKETGNRQKRKFYLMKARALIDDGFVDDVKVKAKVFNELGRYYSDEDVNYDLALQYYTEVLDLCENLNWQKGIAVSLTNMAYVKEQQQLYSEAIRLQIRSLVIKKRINYLYGTVNSYHSIGDLFTKAGNYKTAITYLDSALVIAKQAEMTNMENKISHSIYKTYKKQGNYSEALHFHEQYLILSDSVKSIEQTQIVEELNTKYETNQKEQQIQQLTTEKQVESLKASQQRLIVVSLVVILVILSFLFLIVNRQTRFKRKRNESELNQRLLRSQMNPHFIFNALGSIQNYIYCNEPEEASKYLASFSRLMRNILESTVTETITLDQEIQIVENYLKLQQLRKEDRFDYHVVNKCEEEIIIPPMLAQPFVENCTKHAFKGIDYRGYIRVTYCCQDSYLLVIIEDNGIGCDLGESTSDHQSMAIDLTKKRLKLFKYKKQDAVLKIINRKEEGKNGTKVQIYLPLERCLKF